MTQSNDELLNAVIRLVDGCSVLYVEDEPEIRAEMTEILETLFPRVVATENGAEAWKRFQGEEFLLVITDINMPQMTGIDLIQAIQEVRPQQAILVTSAYSDANHLIPLINLGVGSFILKPLNWRVFLSLVYKEASAALSERRDALYHLRLEKEVKLRTEEVREIQQQLIRLQEAKDNMLSLISHELRTPLNGILGFVELLRSSVKAPEPLGFLAQIEDSARRLERSTRKALDFANLSTGKRPMHREDLQLEALITTAREQVSGHEGLSLRVDAQSLHTDAGLAVEVFKNLLENVLKYAGEETQVIVGASKEGVWDVVSLRDVGPGFPNGMLTTLFQPFSTGNLMHHSEGMVLGLALVDVIMLTLGGRVEALNHPEGGAEVRLRFPRKP